MVENYLSMKVVCPICSALRQEQCHVQKGVLRDEPHSERVELANDAVLDRIGEPHESHRQHGSVGTGALRPGLPAKARCRRVSLSRLG